MTKAYAVIGSAYGDEGKGLFTDYLSNKVDSSIVVRFNGGAQAGHTVTTKTAKHVFGHFGSNSFTDNATTFLSQFFVINPMSFVKEKQQLEKLGVAPKVVISEYAYVTTPYDIMLNHWIEEKRSHNKHGSCGLGFGETIHRNENTQYKLQVKDLLDKVSLKEKILNIRDSYTKARAKELDIEDYLNNPNNEYAHNDTVVDRYLSDVEALLEVSSIATTPLPIPDLQQEIIFEGAQGLLLDQSHGYFPYVTRSNTGLKNIIELLEGAEFNELEVLYATRCYTTRHGAGPLSNKLERAPYEAIIDPTNIPNIYQGTMKFAYLDLDILEETIKKDIASVTIAKSLKFTYKIAISCVDQTEVIKFYDKKELKELCRDDFLKYMKLKFQVPLIISMGPTRYTISEIN